MTKRLKKIAPVQCGKVVGLIYALGTLVFVPFFLVFAAISTLVQPSEGAPPMAILLGMGVGFLIFGPILYGVMGFLTGLIGAFIYNLVANWTGGIEMEVN